MCILLAFAILFADPKSSMGGVRIYEAIKRYARHITAAVAIAGKLK